MCQLPDRVVLDADLATKDQAELFLSVHPYILNEMIMGICKILVNVIMNFYARYYKDYW